ncbi:MAG: hypothetical protein OEW90_00905 [Betaproteobacteria bacterium]|nr:hypothetical protein [Betaproteobacteria bacterium]MDH4322676.1 hypothetical protein [Betaproteobacteria bacterium]
MIGGFQVGAFQPLPAYQQGPAVEQETPIGRPHRRGRGYRPEFIPNRREPEVVVQPPIPIPEPPAPTYIEAPAVIGLGLALSVYSGIEAHQQAVIGFPEVGSAVTANLEALTLDEIPLGVGSNADVSTRRDVIVEVHILLTAAAEIELDPLSKRPISDEDALKILGRIV